MSSQKQSSGQRMFHKLPVVAYTSQSWFQHEQEAIFSNTWRYAGFAEDVAEPGQFISVQAGLNNIFIVMGRDRRLRAFHNICRHRGTQLLRAVGKTQKAITCPYHDWTYDLEGNLVSVPEEKKEFAQIDKSCLGLKPATVDIWRSMLFVHPDPRAESIVNWFGDIEPHLGSHRVEDLVEYPDAATAHTINANWKIVVENYIDVYHLSHLHTGTLFMYDHARAKYGFIGPHYAFWEPLSPEYEDNIEARSPMPLILEKDKLCASVPMLFPGLGLSETENSWSIFHIVPLAPDLTEVKTRTRVKNDSERAFSRQSTRSADFWSKSVTGKYPYDKNTPDDPLTSGDFMAEDVYVCERQQQSMRSPYFKVGPASKGESPVIRHQEIVLDYLGLDK